MNKSKIIKGAALIVQGLGFSLSDVHFRTTPQRITESILFFYQGMNTKKQALKELSVRFPTKHNEPVVLHNLTGQSLCPHHLLPITYRANLAYMPNGFVVGTSKPYKAFEAIAAQPLMLEDVTEQFLTEFFKIVRPKGCIIEVFGKFLCNERNGIDSNEAIISTLSSRGDLLPASILR